MQESFHDYKGKLERTMSKIQNSNIPSQNKGYIRDFVDHCFSEGLSVPRAEKYAGHLKKITTLMCLNFKSATKKDIEDFIRIIELSDYSEWTKRDFRITLKKFFRWLRDTERDPPEVAWLSSAIRNHHHKLPEELLDEKDIIKMIEACDNSRDRALVSMLYESGCRIGEIASLKLKHVVPHTHGFRLIVFGKTGSRRILIISSAPYIKAWLNVHPLKSDPDSFLMLSRDFRNERLCYHRISDILRASARRAGIKKRVNPHSFRHSRATNLANFLTEAQMNEFFGWVQGSNMPAVYVHLSGRDVDNALLRTYGIRSEEENLKENRMLPRVCPGCKTRNSATNKFCSRCGMILDEETARKIVKKELHSEETDGIREMLIKDEEFMEMLQRKLGTMKRTKT